jgi:hypothetical protein
MSKVDRISLPEVSQELIAKLIRAGYLLPDQCQDADAITTSIARMKKDLRRGGDDDRIPPFDYDDQLA